MAERVTLTSEQAEALRKLRAKFNDPWRKRAGKEIEWVPLEDETRPHKVLTPELSKKRESTFVRLRPDGSS
jgi:hypothetical protein